MQERAERRFRATVHYDGSGFHGWQIQPEDRTVQGELESALQELLQRSVGVTAAGRTDRGVHAAGQETSFSVPPEWTADELRRALNAVLPPDIWVEKLSRASVDFHPRYDATARHYVYLVGTTEDSVSPLRRGRIWQMGDEPDEDLLARDAERLVGEHEFDAFAKSGQPERGVRCRVETARWQRTSLDDLAFRIVADRFLHHMVRYLAATLMDVALGRRPSDDVARLLAGAEEPRAPEPAPPEGLYLAAVRYPDGWNRPAGLPGLCHP